MKYSAVITAHLPRVNSLSFCHLKVQKNLSLFFQFTLIKKIDPNPKSLSKMYPVIYTIQRKYVFEEKSLKEGMINLAEKK